MQVLSALLLTHCLGCVILQGIDDKLMLNKFDDIKFWKKCIPKIYKNINVCVKDNCTLQRSNHSLTNQFTFSHRQKMFLIKSKSKHSYKLQKYIRPFEKYHHQRKLLIYGERDISEYFSTYKKDSKRHVKATTSQYYHLRQRKQSDNEDDEEPDKEYLDDWDDWGTWSPCSVTCGCGQQVRWRHCITDDCIKGLKKVQIKTCHLRPCDKGFLSWLGIKL
ncbi:uncharacterized protein LOC124956587 [Vespa velutina]|uniref:uncharacterized protein LOC124956587 n=1 Tax=Vespa velutina TaxID=202808 RepID=UPI001FB35377|nr:uncharacterized protein LOC124956587 [Vespa velutina]